MKIALTRFFNLNPICMARQIGTLKVQGTVDNVTFAQTADGSIVKKKTNISRRKIMTSAAFSRTRETINEFTTAAAAGKLLRASLNTLLQDAKDSKLSSRMLQAMMAVLKQDATSARGARTVTGGNVTLLQGFDFNVKSHIGSVISAPFTATIDRTTGALSIAIASLIPAQSIAAPQGTTHFKLVSAGVDANFDEGTYVKDESDSGMLVYDNTTSGVLDLSNTVTPNSTNPLFLVLGVRFYSEVNGVQYPLKDSLYNGLTIVKVSAA
jgi:hypothetical protein